MVELIAPPKWGLQKSGLSTKSHYIDFFLKFIQLIGFCSLLYKIETSRFNFRHLRQAPKRYLQLPKRDS